MRKLLVLLPLALAGCGDNGDDFGTSPQPMELQEHVPQIAELSLSPNTVVYMDGDGSVSVMVQFEYTDSGLDIAMVNVEISDGTSLSMPFPDEMLAESGTHTETIDMSTAAFGAYTVEVWLVDGLGATSDHATAAFEVIAKVEVAGWTQQLSRLPFVLNDVVWDGNTFVAVGDDGAILTSADGTAWAERESGTDVRLTAVAYDDTVIAAVGHDATVLLSTNHGVTWSIKHSGAVNLQAVVVKGSQIVAGGMAEDSGNAFMLRSADLGESWTEVGSLPSSEHFVSELAYADGVFVAGTDIWDWEGDTRVLVSFDGEFWQELILRDEVASIDVVVHDGERFFAAGSQGTVFRSADGFHWTEQQTPSYEIDFRGAVYAGSTLVLHGGLPWWYWWGGTPQHQDAGLASTNGGATWQTFDIDGFYGTNGMAYGNGRFVSVGATSPISGEGAIYTSP